MDFYYDQILALFFGWLSDVNPFSTHSFYAHSVQLSHKVSLGWLKIIL